VIFEELGLEAGLGGSPLREHGVVSGASVSIELEKRPFGVLEAFNEELGRRIEDRTARLAEANSELESFSYCVSHDLRAPLRYIGGFAQMLQRRSGSSLDKVSATLRRSSRRSSTPATSSTISSLSPAWGAGMRQIVMDMNRIVHDARSDLQLEVEGREIARKGCATQSPQGSFYVAACDGEPPLQRREAHAYP
jgi:signal transduction histidine kinase